MLDHIHWDNGLTINLSISIVIIVGVFSTSNVYVMCVSGTISNSVAHNCEM